MTVSGIAVPNVACADRRCATMCLIYGKNVCGPLIAFTQAQSIFFVATAPRADCRIDISPNDLLRQREQLPRRAESKAQGLRACQQDKNAPSIDGLPAPLVMSTS